MNKVYLLAFSITCTLFISGCSALAIGDTQESQCDGTCNFKKAGVCADVITIYTHRKELKNRKVKEHTFSSDEDPYQDKKDDSHFLRLNDETLDEN